MTSKKKVTMISLSIALVVGGLWYYNHYYTGSRSGRVVDAVAGEPIEGAVVCMRWHTGGFLGMGGVCAASYETRTDSQGRYCVPNQRLRRSSWFESVGREDVLVYKSGYCVYRVHGSSAEPTGRSFGKASENQPYRPTQNLVRLFPFGKSDDHLEHLQWIKTFGGVWEHISLLEEELEQERELAESTRSIVR